PQRTRRITEEKQESWDPSRSFVAFVVSTFSGLGARFDRSNCTEYHSAAMKPCFLLALLTATALAQTRPNTPAGSGDEILQLLRALADAPGPSGFEEPVRKIMVERMKPLSDKIMYDGMGSVIAVQGTSGPRIM